MMVSGLQAAPAGPPSPTDDSLDDNSIRFISYLHKISGIIDPDTDAVCTDHGYSKPWNWRPENVYVKPTRKLFFSKNPETSRHKYNEEIDVENVPESMIPDIPCDMSRSRQSLEDFQRLSNFAKPEQDDNWEENINKTFWTPIQTRIFNRVFRILTAERLSRLAKVSSKLEPIYRRVSVDTASRKFREILASSGWDWQLIQWLHILLFECLPKEYLSIYLDILQTLRTTIPQLIDKMISAQPNIIGKNDTVTWETLGSLLKRSWDPLTNFLNSNRPKKLPGNPILLIIPSGFGNTITSSQQKWITQFDSFGKTINISTNLGIPQNRVTMLSSMDQLVQNIRSKIQDTRNNYQSRPIILIGFNTGAALACQIAQMEHVTAVVCLGFPFYTAEGKRGSPDDILMDMRCPVMFIIGQNATLIRADDIEEAREKMPVETSLIVVGSADDNLRISRNKKILEGITQSLVDRCIAEEIGDFIGNILVQPHPLPLRPIGPASSSNSNNNNNNNSNNNNKEIKKRKTSTSSSVDSEISLSNVNKKSRPNTPVEKGQNQPRQVSSSTQINTNLINSGTNGTKKKPRMSANQRIEQQLAKIQQQQLQLQQQQQQQHLLQQQQLQQQQQAIQTMENTNNNGLTVQIGSLASLAPIGPIKFNSGQVGAGVGRGNSVTKSTNTPGRGQKFIQTGNIGKRSSLTVTGMTKGVGRGAGLVDKQDTKLLITPGTSGSNSQIKITPSTSTGSQSKVVGNTNVNLAGQLSNRKGQLNKTTNFPSGLSITPVNFNDIPTSALSTKISSTSITKGRLPLSIKPIPPKKTV